MSKSNCTFVTALYNIHTPDTRTHAGLEKRFDLLKRLFSLNISIIAFMDPEYHPLFDTKEYPNVMVIYRPLESFLFWNMCKNPSLILPSTRNTGKDTLEFLSLMNTKIEFVKEALSYCTTPVLAWIDGSIFHIIHDEERVKNALEKDANISENLIKIPGPVQLSSNSTPFHVLANHIQWKFCGGYFQGTRDGIENFYKKSLETLRKWTSNGYLTWEVNIWVDMWDENKEEDKIFQWVYGDHNDSMLLLNE